MLFEDEVLESGGTGAGATSSGGSVALGTGGVGPATLGGFANSGGANTLGGVATFRHFRGRRVSGKSKCGAR